MRINVNEFLSIEDAERAQKEFPLCGTCKNSTKLQVWDGRVFLWCIKNPWHHGIGDWK